MVKAKVIDLTPEIAKTFMTHNIDNRRISPMWVNTLADDLKNGRWHNNGEPITFTTDGIMVSGQHRCLAVIKSGVTMKDVVIVETDDPEMIDTARPRSVTDLYGISTNMSSAISSIISMSMTKNRNISKAYINEKYLEWKTSCDYVFEKVVMKAGLRKGGLLGSLIAAHLCGYPEDLLDRFCNILSSGIIERPQDKVIIYLRDAALMGAGTRALKNQLYLKTQSALKIYKEGRVVSRLYALSEPVYKVAIEGV